MTREERQAASRAVCARLAERWPGREAPPLAASFASLPGEVELSAWHGLLRARGVAVAFPRIDPDLSRRAMDFFIVENETDWQPGPYGLREPDPARCRRVEPGEIGLHLVPGLAFSAEGARLGQGGGYYDRWLAKVPDATPLVGVCFACQIVDSVPTAAHDRRVPHVVTDEGWLGGASSTQ